MLGLSYLPQQQEPPSPSGSFVTFLVLLYRGYNLEELDQHISLLHEYNEIKDAGQMLLGKLGKEGKAGKDLFSQCFHTDTKRSCCHRGKACVADSSLKKKVFGQTGGTAAKPWVSWLWSVLWNNEGRKTPRF